MDSNSERLFYTSSVPPQFPGNLDQTPALPTPFRPVRLQLNHDRHDVDASAPYNPNLLNAPQNTFKRRNLPPSLRRGHFTTVLGPQEPYQISTPAMATTSHMATLTNAMVNTTISAMPTSPSQLAPPPLSFGHQPQARSEIQGELLMKAPVNMTHSHHITQGADEYEYAQPPQMYSTPQTQTVDYYQQSGATAFQGFASQNDTLSSPLVTEGLSSVKPLTFTQDPPPSERGDYQYLPPRVSQGPPIDAPGKGSYDSAMPLARVLDPNVNRSPKIPMDSPLEKPLRICPKRIPISHACFWYHHCEVPEFLICSNCYSTQISPTKFAPSFTREWKEEGTARRCMFHVDRIKEVLWKQAIAAGNLLPVQHFMARRVTIRACPGTKQSNSTAGVKYYSHIRNEPVDGFIACEACYEDTLLAKPFRDEFQPYPTAQTEANFWACDIALLPVQRAFDASQGHTDWISPAKIACNRLPLPDCPRIDGGKAFSIASYKL